MISVIVPVYNAASYLDDCINSIINQTYQELEIIMVDDGSTDRSPDICDRLSGEDPRVHVIHKANGGSSSARNAGIDAAKGEFLSFIDADDFIEDSMYSDMMYEMKNPKVSIVGCGIDIVDIDGNERRVFNDERIEYSGEQALAELFRGTGKVNASSCTKLFRKKLYDRVGCYVPTIDHEDTEFTVRALGASERVVILNKAFYHYIKRKGSKTTDRHFSIRGYRLLAELKKYKTTCQKEHLGLLPDYYYYELMSNYGMLQYYYGCIDRKKYYGKMIALKSRITGLAIRCRKSAMKDDIRNTFISTLLMHG